MKKFIALILFSLAGSNAFAESPIGSEPVPTMFHCKAQLGQQVGSEYKSQTKLFTMPIKAGGANHDECIYLNEFNNKRLEEADGGLKMRIFRLRPYANSQRNASS